MEKKKDNDERIFWFWNIWKNFSNKNTVKFIGYNIEYGFVELTNNI